MKLEKRKKNRKLIKYILLFFLLLVVFAIFFYYYPRLSISKYILDKPEYLKNNLADVPETTAALVFGAGYQDDGGYGKLYQITKDRVSAAVKLYKAGKISRIIVSGDNSSAKYDEPTAMKKEAIEQGVPAIHIRRDFGGRRTYDSCYRIKNVWNLDKIICITQDYHLPRAVYTCRGLGINAIGIPAELLVARKNRYYKQTYYSFREILATWNAWLEVNITTPEPSVPGSKENVMEPEPLN